jgi:hypothetical protein
MGLANFTGFSKVCPWVKLIARSRLSPSVEVKDFQLVDTSFVIAEAIWITVAVGAGAPSQVIRAISTKRMSEALAIVGMPPSKIRKEIEIEKYLLRLETPIRLIGSYFEFIL